MKRVLSIVLCFVAVFAVAVFLTACGQSEKKGFKLGVSLPAADHGWSAGVIWNAEQTKAKLEKEYPGTEIILVTAKDSTDQVKSLETLLVQNVDALVIMAQSPDPLQNVCARAKKSGVLLSIVSNKVKNVEEDIFIKGDNISFGQSAAHAMGKLLNGKGNIVYMNGMLCPVNTDRVTGFKSVLEKEYPNIKILEAGDTDWQTAKGQQVMDLMLQKHPQIDGVWAGDDDVLTGVLAAYQKSGRKDVKVFVGGGGSKMTVKMLMDNNPLVKATVSYPPSMMSVGMEAALEALQNGGKVKQHEISVPTPFITHENAKDFYFPASPY